MGECKEDGTCYTTYKIELNLGVLQDNKESSHNLC